MLHVVWKAWNQEIETYCICHASLFRGQLMHTELLLALKADKGMSFTTHGQTYT